MSRRPVRRRAGALCLLAGLASAGGCAFSRGRSRQAEGPAAAEPDRGSGKVTFAGVRSSNYGIRPFPEPAGWDRAIATMAGYFPGASPMAIWIVGRLDRPAGGCRLEFPSPADGIDRGSRITFSDADKHERFLSRFDASGVRVFLQVEPGFADVATLVDLVLGRYQRHPSVIGFGIDVEWFQNTENDGVNGKATDERVREWETRVKSHDPRFRLFVKHFWRRELPPRYRGDVVFVNDSQQFRNYRAFLAEYKRWAEFFYPNPVIYQIGYRADRPWWSALPAPVPQTMGRDLCRQTRQDCGIAWVDFTLREVLPAE